jgi:hypothetical protein
MSAQIITAQEHQWARVKRDVDSYLRGIGGQHIDQEMAHMWQCRQFGFSEAEIAKVRALWAAARKALKDYQEQLA